MCESQIRILSCDGKLHVHNPGPCELQNGTELELLEGHLEHWDSFWTSGRPLEVSGQCFFTRALERGPRAQVAAEKGQKRTKARYQKSQNLLKIYQK